MWKRSVFRTIGPRWVPQRYIELLVATGVTELWSSQVEVVRAGLLSRDSALVVNLPTGAGKSLIAELAVVRALLQHQSAWGLYVVPTRALVRQVETDLRQRLPQLGIGVRTVIAGAEIAATLGSEVTEIIRPKTLTILTPEKLDIYVRNSPDLFASCRLLIVDEAHKIADPRRGALIDTLLTRFLLLAPSARLLLLSAVLSNVLQIAEWLHSPQGGVRSLWRPTRQLKGVMVRTTGKTYRILRPIRGHQARNEIITPYQGGVVLAEKAADIGAGWRIDLPNLFAGEERRWQNEDGKTKYEQPTTTDHAVELAVRFARLHGVTVVFLGTQPSAEKCARDVAKALRHEDRLAAPNALVERLSVLLGEQHELVRLVRVGVAYHHGGLPTPVRRAIETALRTGAVRVVCATATLQEGLNTPATTVIVAGTQRWDNEQNRAVNMSVADFTNIAGRAGRAGRDTEGQVILVPSRLPQAQVDGQRYLFPPDQEFAVESALRAIEIELEKAASISELPPLSQATQTTLLALQAAGLGSELDLGRFFASSLALVQSGRSAVPIARAAYHFLSRAEQRYGAERLGSFARTAFALDSCEQLDASLRALVESGYDVTADLYEGGEIAPKRLEPLLAAVLTVSQVQSRQFPDADVAPGAAVLLARWMNGASYTDLAAHPRFTGSVEHAVKYLGAATNQLAWGLGAAYLLLQLLVPSVSIDFGLLPLFIEFGVNSGPAAYLSLLGISDRTTARQFGEAFLEDYREGITDFSQVFDTVERWLRQLTVDRVEVILGERSVQTPFALDDLGLHNEGESRPVRLPTTTKVTLAPESTENAGSLIGQFCDFVASENPLRTIRAVGLLGRAPWGIVQEPSALFQQVSGEGDLDQMFGVVIGAQRIELVVTLDVQLWQRAVKPRV